MVADNTQHPNKSLLSKGDLEGLSISEFTPIAE